ncbi:hypothetical protein GCM10010197_42430 [Nocardioides luteus]|nr:hypothetical protein GCM10010197_42430 [Nocardioides luteus]
MAVDFSAPISGAGPSAAPAGPDMARMVVAAPTAVTVAAARAPRRWFLWGRFTITAPVVKQPRVEGCKG